MRVFFVFNDKDLSQKCDDIPVIAYGNTVFAGYLSFARMLFDPLRCVNTPDTGLT